MPGVRSSSTDFTSIWCFQHIVLARLTFCVRAMINGEFRLCISLDKKHSTRSFGLLNPCIERVPRPNRSKRHEGGVAVRDSNGDSVTSQTNDGPEPLENGFTKTSWLIWPYLASILSVDARIWYCMQCQTCYTLVDVCNTNPVILWLMCNWESAT